MRIAEGRWVHRLIKDALFKAKQAEQELSLYKFALENAYEGIVIVDPQGIVLSASRAYASFLHVDIADMVGKHVTEVIPNTRLHIVARTGKAEIADLQQINGNWMIASRIPIWRGSELVAVVGKIMFQHIDRLFEMNSKYRDIQTHLHYNDVKGRDMSGAKYGFEHLIGDSEPLKRLKALARKVAKSDSTVFITGESGTGKELLAHAIHRDSLRRFGPFIAVNCATIPETLFESEMFGYKEGSFTGAKRSGKKGKLQLAHKGTCFLDEIGELTLPQQAKLLRVLQEKEIEPVGGDRPEPIDVRFIAATNVDLPQLVREGKFRQDLYYRIHVIPLHMAPLRERLEDIKPIALALLRQLVQETGIACDGIDADCERLMLEYEWPGNVREMRNVLERALYMMEGTTMNRPALPPELTRDASVASQGEKPVVVQTSAEPEQAAGSWKQKMALYERQLLRESLRQAGGDKQQAAQLLGMSKSSLYEKLERYEIRDE
jgi:transcriptional regulator with PAS, ATPase and Fis domain